MVVPARCRGAHPTSSSMRGPNKPLQADGNPAQCLAALGLGPPLRLSGMSSDGFPPLNGGPLGSLWR